MPKLATAHKPTLLYAVAAVVLLLALYHFAHKH